MKVSGTLRATVRTYLKEHAKWDAATLRINRDGDVSARYDPDKVPGCDSARRRVGNIRYPFSWA